VGAAGLTAACQPLLQLLLGLHHRNCTEPENKCRNLPKINLD
jgi:hypothetical protein